MNLDPVPCPNPWRARHKKKKRRRPPQIAFESAESEIEALSDACVPPSGAQAKPQEVSTSMLDFDRRAIMVYGIPPSGDPSTSTRAEYEISKLRLYFSKILAEYESVSECKANRVGPMGTNGDNRHRPLKVILSSDQDLKLLLSRKRKLASFAPNIFFTGTTPYLST